MTAICPRRSVPTIRYEGFYARIATRVSRERIPLDGSIELTFRCNLRCVHCYVNEPPGARRVRHEELSTREIHRITDEAVDLGCLYLLLTGGEPLLRSDFMDIYLHMKRRGVVPTLFTNGTMLTPRVADFLAEWPPFSVEITVYGSTQPVYEAVTGIPGSYRRCIEGIERLLNRKLRVCLKTIPMTLNSHDMDGMRSLAAWFGLKFHWDPLINCRVDGGTGPAAVRLSGEQIAALDAQEPVRAEHFRKEFRERHRFDPPEDLVTCGAYLNTFHIDPYGNLFPCMLVRWPAYNLQEGSLRQGWEEFFPAMRARLRTRAVPCDGCAYNAACDRCIGWSQIETGDPEGLIPFLCEVTRARARAFGETKPPLF
ncbi:MAG: radical SAM protein [candidate division NC10 bacterium]|nr:radical SAM protein [candidate division NC10 bacterium]